MKMHRSRSLESCGKAPIQDDKSPSESEKEIVQDKPGGFPGRDENIAARLEVVLTEHDYKLIRILGSGGEGKVFEVSDKENKRWACKVSRVSIEWRHFTASSRSPWYLPASIMSSSKCRIKWWSSLSCYQMTICLICWLSIGD